MDITSRIWTELSGTLNINAGTSDSSTSITNSTIKHTPAVVRSISANIETASAISIKVLDTDGSIIAAMSTPIGNFPVGSALYNAYEQSCFGIIEESSQLPLTVDVYKPPVGTGGVDGNVRVRVNGTYESMQL